MANETTLKMTLLLRRAKFEDTCVLAAGEPGCYLDFKADGTLNANDKNYTLKVGDGKTQWKDLPIANKTQIDAIVSAAITAHAAGYYTKGEIDSIKQALQQATSKVASDLSAEVTARTNADTELQNQIDAKLATETFNTWKGTHETGHAKSATEITTEITTAVNGEKALREAADNAINAKIGTGFDDGANTVAKKIAAAEAAAKAHAEEKATKAYTDAVAEAEAKDATRAQTTATNLANAVSALETQITTGDSTTLATAKKYTDDQVAAEAKLRSDADDALDGRLDTVEAKLNNVSNVMDFVGAGAALPAAETSQKGDVFVINSGDDAGKEFVFDGTNWVEFGFATANEGAIAALQSRMGVAEGEIDQAQADIIALGTNKLDKSTYETYISDKSMSDADLKKYAEDEADAAQSAAEAEAARLDGVLKIELQNEIDDDVAAAIAAEVTRSDAKAKELADKALADAKSDASSKDAALKTAIEGVADTAKSADTTIEGAKKYAEEKASAAQTAAINAAAADATSKANAAKTEAISAAATDATNKANTAETNAKSYADTEIAKEKKRAEDEEAEIRGEFAAADVTTLTSAKTYADTVAANAVKNNIKAGNADIVIDRPTSGENKDKTVISHKDYSTGTFTKNPDPLTKTNDTYFFKSITVNNGHVTGGEMKSLAEALSAMSFIFDGGTSAN